VFDLWGGAEPLLEIVLTREDANSESVLLVEWLVADREAVRRGQPICVIETSKSTIEIEASGDGTLRHLAAAGDEVAIGDSIAAIAATPEEAAGIDAPARRLPPRAAGPGRVTRKAAELAAEHGIDLDRIEKTGFVTAQDVEALIAETHGDELQAAGAHEGISTEGVSLPAVYTLDDPSTGLLEESFLASLRADPASFAALSSDEKCAAYAEHGARIGEGVRFGPGAVVAAPRIVLEDGVELTAGVSVECGEVFAAGALTRFGNALELRCRRAYVGGGGYLARGVRIGGGGYRDPQALLVLGDLVYVGDEAFINPGRPVLAGAEVFITMRSMIITHNIGHSLLEGFENRFAPVVLEDRVQVGVGAVIYAGSRIGRESIVASNSYVVTDIPPGRLAIGIPARAVGSARRELAPARVWELAETMVDELHELLALTGHTVSPVEGLSAGEGEPKRGFSIELDDSTAQVLLADRVDSSFDVPAAGGEIVVLTLGVEGSPPEGAAVVDLLGRRVHGGGGVVLESVREFCRKRGIRLEPGPWRYRSGLI
jgi:acetyltransferase-like isoleucine patch superfamily enzyme